MKIAILGAGKMAQAAAHYLFSDERCEEFVCYDISKDNLAKCEKFSGSKGQIRQLDVTDFKKLLAALQDCDGVINTLPYILLEETTYTCILAGKSMVDLGGNDKMVAAQKAMRHLAVEAGATIVPACGLAPGLISDLAWNAKRHFLAVALIRMYCGGLPQNPEGELRHAFSFNEEGLYNEYAELPKVIDQGAVLILDRLYESLCVTFSHPRFSQTLESALTHGAFDADPDFWGNVKYMYYATLRYPGHFEKIREMIATLSKLDCVKQMKEKMGPGGEDLVALRVEAIGKVGIFGKGEYVYELVDFYDEKTGLSAMQRCTAFPATETVLQILAGNWPKGVVHHEPYIDMASMIDNLALHNIQITNSMIVRNKT